MKNQRGMTLVELLAVIVILAIVSAIAFVVAGRIISNTKADAHLANARQMLEAGQMAYHTGLKPTGIFYGAESFTLRDIANEGLFNEKIKSPTSHDGWDKLDDTYDPDESIIVLYMANSGDQPIFKVNLSIGNKNYLFGEPIPREEISRDKLTVEFKKVTSIK